MFLELIGHSHQCYSPPFLDVLQILALAKGFRGRAKSNLKIARPKVERAMVVRSAATR